jgi:hypothetical protein
MSAEELTRLVTQLSPEEQSVVKEFIVFLKGRKGSPFLAAIEEFVAAHPELLRRLAQ